MFSFDLILNGLFETQTQRWSGGIKYPLTHGIATGIVKELSKISKIVHAKDVLKLFKQLS